MKLKIYAFVALALSMLTFRAVAQTAPKTFPQTFNKAQTDIQPVGHEKATGVGSRLIGSSAYKSNGSTILPVDSQAFTYPGITTLLSDATYQFTYGSGIWTPSYKYAFSYNAAGNVTGYDVLRWYTTSNTWNPYQRVTYTLNSDGYPMTMLAETWNSTSSTYQNAYQYLYVRDAANFPTQYTTQQWNFTYNRWDNVARYTYTYNSKHAYTQYVQEAWLTLYNTWLNQMRLDYAYDASDTVQTLLTQYAWASNVQNWARVYNTYYFNNATTNKPDSALMKSFNSSGGEQNFRRIMFTFNADKQVTSETAEIWYSNNTYGNLYQILTSYNSFGQQTVQDVKYWQSNAWSYANANAYRNNNYYENYTTAVAPTGNTAITKINLSPIPATNVLDIAMQWSVPQDFTVMITDLSGKTVSQFSRAAQAQFYTSISVANIPAGIYLVSVKGTKGGTATRMITVQH